MRILGIDVGANNIKFCLADVKKHTFLVRRLFQAAVPNPFTPLDQKIDDVAAVVSETIAAQHLGHDRMVLGIPSTMCSFRFVKVPFGTRGKIDKIISYEIEDMVPFSAEELIIDYQIIHKEKNVSELMVAMVPSVNYDYYLSAFSEKNINSDIVMPDTVGLGIFAERYVPAAENASVFVDIGYQHSSMAIVSEGRIVYIRPIPFGYVNFSRHIHEKTKYKPEEVEALIMQYDQFTEEQQKTYQPVLDDAFTELVVEVNQTMGAYRAQSKKPTSMIYVSGGFGAFSYVIPTLAGEFFGSTVQSVNALSSDVSVKSARDMNNIDLHAYATAIGYTAAYASPRKKEYINFRRKETKTKKVIKAIQSYFELPTSRRAVRAILLVLVILIPYFVAKYWLVNKSYDESLRNIDGLIRRSVSANLNRDQRADFIENPKKLMDFIQKQLADGEGKLAVFEKRQISAAIFIYRVMRSIPADLKMDIIDLDFNQRETVMRTQIHSGNIELFLSALRATPFVSTLETRSISRDITEIIIAFRQE